MSNFKLRRCKKVVLLAALLVALVSCTLGLPGNLTGADPGEIYDTATWTALPAELAGSNWTGTVNFVNNNTVTAKVVDSWMFNGDGTSIMQILGEQTGEVDIYEGRCALDAAGKLKYVLKLTSRKGIAVPADSETLWGEAQLELTAGTASDTDANLFTKTGADTLKQTLQLTLVRKSIGGGNGQTDAAFSAAVTTDGTGSGSINAAASTANGTYKVGTDVTVQAVADAGSSFVGWYDAPSGGKLLSTSAIYTFTLTKTTTVYAAFGKNVNYTFAAALTTASTGLGTINSQTSTANGSYNDSTYITVEAVAGAGNRFNGWYSAATGGQLLSTAKVYGFKLTANTEVYAAFTAAPQYSFSAALAADGEGTGTIKAGSTVNGSYAEGTDITVEAVADKGSRFIGWYDAAAAGVLVSADALYTFKLSQATALYAKFELLTFTFATGLASGGQGTGSIDAAATTADGSYKAGTAVTAVALADAGSVFTGWYSAATGGTVVSKEATFSTSLTDNMGLYARFEQDLYVTFEDIALEIAVRKAVNKTTGKLTYADVAGLTTLSHGTSNSTASPLPITSLKGIEHLTGLTTLKLDRNQIVDITPLASLTNLTKLEIRSNKIKDITPLSSLTKLTELYMPGNYVVNIEPLANLSALVKLDLSSNDVVTIAALENLINLDYLDLEYNKITDISVLLRNIGIGTGDVVDLYGNSVPSVQKNTLKMKGVTVR